MDTTKAKRELGWPPTHSSAETLAAPAAALLVSATEKAPFLFGELPVGQNAGVMEIGKFA